MFARTSVAKKPSANKVTRPTLQSSYPLHCFPAGHKAVSRPPKFSYNFANLRPFAPGEDRDSEWQAQRALMPLPAPMQAKLEVGALDDALEREADQLANLAMRMPDPAIGAPAGGGPVLRRKCAHCKEEEEHKNLTRKATGPAATLDRPAAPPIVLRVLGSPGQPLDPATRAFFEPRFETDLSAVRVHSDALAANSARSVNALAYTVGHQIVLGAGASDAPNRLMAHELAHVVQQDGASRRNDVVSGTVRPRLQRQSATPGTMGTQTPGSQSGVGQSQQVDCAGWEGDPQSFCTMAAKYYLREVWQPSFGVGKVECNAPPPNWDCDVTVNAGAGLIKLHVKLSPGNKIVRVDRAPDPQNHMHCFYSYRCLPNGQLVLSGPRCPEF